jgi:Raf kinase inhibitor-like YbhB/YbcL family protein
VKFLYLLPLLIVTSVSCQETRDTIMEKQITLWSSNFTPGDSIPLAHTCKGEERSPHLMWEKGPETTKSYCMIMTDRDAPIPLLTITHWIVYNIPADCTSLHEGLSVKQGNGGGMQFGKRFSGKHRYLGPCPPFGVHRYFFTLYALDTTLTVKPAKATRRTIMRAIKGHIIALGEMYGTFSK